MDLNGKKVLIIGTGISGIGAANLLAEQKVPSILYDENEKADKDKIISCLKQQEMTQIVLGKIPQHIKVEIGLVVLSPGVPFDISLVEEMRARSVKVWGEIELAYHFEKGKVAAITGTNGKTTTTALVGAIMKAYYEKVFIVGNIGIPYTTIALETTKQSVTVAEISSFQLETVEFFQPHVSAILNITPDHLDRHKTMENYIKVKEDIVKNQKEEHTCVLNYDDENLRSFGQSLKCKVFYFSVNHLLDEGIYWNENKIYYRSNGKTQELLKMEEIKLLGKHNYENVMAAISIALQFEVPMDIILKVVREFQGVEHRIEFVTEMNGVRFYNDSKATNPDAAIKGIQAMDRPTLLIGGGYDKNSKYDDWIRSFEGKVNYLILLGATSGKIAEAAQNLDFNSIILVESLEEAVSICKEKANKGDAVLLSPACASWGMFRNFEERGDEFKKLVLKLKE